MTLADGSPVHKLTIDQGRFRSLAYTPDGAFLVALDSWGTLHFWDAATFERRLTLVVPAFWSDHRLVFSCSRRHLLLGGRLWDIGPLLEQLSEGAVSGGSILFERPPLLEPHCLAFAPDGRFVARCIREPPVPPGQVSGLELWDLRGRARVEFDCPGYIHRTQLQPVAFAPDGRTLAGTQVNYSVRLWSVTTGEEVALLEHTDKVHAVAYAPDGRLLATAAEGVIRLWNARTFRCLKTFRPFQRDAMALVFHPGGRVLGAASHDGTARLWDLARGKELAVQDWGIGALYGLAIAPNGQSAAVIGEKSSLVVWELDL
jgi:WD40 repeat protein